MKKIIILFSALIISANCFPQTIDNPFFGKLAEIKSTSETMLKAHFTEEQLIANAIVLADDKDKAKDKKILEFYEKDKKALVAYGKLKITVDVLVNQLKADLTISNKKANLENLNKGILTGWYDTQIKTIIHHYNDFTASMGGDSNFKALSVSDVTGIFSAVVTAITSARDFRAQMITTMCAQLDSLKITDAYDIMSGNDSSSPSSADASSTKPVGKSK
ncbi:MAG: hypothetical protein ACTHNW_19530 [Mucilaginibacter sp.]